jgi:hypothetical protein
MNPLEQAQDRAKVMLAAVMGTLCTVPPTDAQLARVIDEWIWVAGELLKTAGMDDQELVSWLHALLSEYVAKMAGQSGEQRALAYHVYRVCSDVKPENN